MANKNELKDFLKVFTSLRAFNSNIDVLFRKEGEKIDLGQSDVWVLYVLFLMDKPVKSSDFSRSLSLWRSNASSLFIRLDEKGLIRYYHSDKKKSMLVELTDEGAKKVEDLHNAVCSLFEGIKFNEASEMTLSDLSLINDRVAERLKTYD